MKGSEKGAKLNVTKQTICFNIQLGENCNPIPGSKLIQKFMHLGMYVVA